MKKILFAFLFVCLAALTSAEEKSEKPAVFNNGLVPVNTVESAGLLIQDLRDTYGDAYANAEFQKRLDAISAALQTNPNDEKAKQDLQQLVREASLQNPLLDFDRILVVKRNRAHGYGFPGLNSHTNTTINPKGWDNEICVLSNLRAENPTLTTLYKHPFFDSITRDLELHFDAEKLMFSALNSKGHWAIFEMSADGKNLQELTPDDQEDVDWFDSTYLPEDGAFVTCSTAGMQGLPCENGGRPMVNIYRVDRPSKAVRQLTFEQDSDYHPTLLPNGRVMYLRWEYTDIPHYFSRILFSMNPDGEGQRAMWGSGSYFPTAFKHARPVPGTSMVVGIVGGHHAEPESGRLLLIDPALGNAYPFKPIIDSKEWGPEAKPINIMTQVFPKEVTGCVQEIPGHGRNVFGNVYDNQGGESDIRFVYPYPLSDKYFLVCARMRGEQNFGLWLVDIFDNMTKLMQLDGDYSLFEPMPLVKQAKPPVIPDFTDHQNPDATIFITNVYHGRGLPGVPRGKAKSLRIISYHYGYIGSGGHESVGQSSGWDIKRILGTVPIEEDGSVCFKAPANTPMAFQILDENGAAIQVMRSWAVAMPGEKLACVGCHEKPNDVTPVVMTIAGRKAPQEIQPWFGPARAFGYEAEVQPVLDKYCLSCHNDEKNAGNLSLTVHNPGDWRTDTSYANLNPYVRRYGTEFDMRTMVPMEYHVSTSELVQRLRGGHHGVVLDDEAWSRLYTWIDLNAPYRGMWSNSHFEKRRRELQELYAYHTGNPEEEYREALEKRIHNIQPVIPPAETVPADDDLKVQNYPFKQDEASKMQGENARREVEIAPGVKITFVRIPAGTYICGSQPSDSVFPNEYPRRVVTVEKPFWMSETEITNAQYAAFDPEHETGYQREEGKDHPTPGYIANHPRQPVTRVSWNEAMDFAKWVGEKTGHKAALPTEIQWEWAARGGSDKTFFYGDRNADFSDWANLADAGVRKTYTSWEGGSTIHSRRWFPENQRYPLRDDKYEDHWFTVDYVRECQANPWGLYDMIGNVSEWTRSENPDDSIQMVRGGSWNDRRVATGSATRKPYERWQKVFDVGIRLIIEDLD